MKTLSRTLTTCAASAALLLATIGVAQAYDPDAPVNDVAEAIDAVAPDAGDVLSPEVTGGDFATSMNEISTIVPADPSAPVAIASADQAVADLTVTLPDLAGVDDARQAEDGTIVYTSDDDASLAVQALADGSTRFLSVLENENAPERYDYTFDGLELVLQEDGSVDVFDAVTLMGVVAAPWATGADGAAVPTHYEVNGSTLTQVVEHLTANYVYPIAADPKVSIGLGYYFHFNRAETATWSSYGVAGIAAVTTGCSAAGTALGALAAGVGAPIGGLIGGAFCSVSFGPFIHNAGVAQRSKPKACVYLRVTGTLVTSGIYKDKRCV